MRGRSSPGRRTAGFCRDAGFTPGARRRAEAAPRTGETQITNDGALTKAVDSDATLMARAGTGDRAAWRTLYLAHLDFVYRTAYRFTGDEADARDITQDVFLSLFLHAGAWKPAASLPSWLWRLVANRCLNEKARAGHRRAGGADAPALESIAEPSDRAPDARIERREEQERVRAAIQELPERQRLAVILSRYEEFSYEGIAQALSTSVSAVETLLFRARRSLAQKLGPSPQVLTR